MPGPQIVTTRQPLRRGKSEYESPYLLVYMPHTFYIYAEWIYPCCALLVGMGPPQGNRCPIFLFERPCPSYALKRHLPSQNRGTSQNGSLHLLASLSPQEVASKHICFETSTHKHTHRLWEEQPSRGFGEKLLLRPQRCVPLAADIARAGEEVHLRAAFRRPGRISLGTETRKRWAHVHTPHSGISL